MKEVKNDFFALIKYALDNQKYNKVINDADKLFQMANDAGVAGLIYQTLVKENIEQDSYHKFEKAFYLFTKKDVITNLDILEISELFSNNQIKHIFLKGSFLKQIYPESYMRLMGDIDVLVSEEDLPKASKVFAEYGYKHFLTNQSHTCYISNRKTLIEVHGRLNSEDTDRYTKFLKRTWEEVYQISDYRYELNPEYNLVYLLIHLVKHLNSSGIGVRSVLDIGIFVNYFYDNLNEEKLMMFLQETKLELFFKNMLWLNEKCFGFDFSKYLEGFNQDESFLEEVTDYIILSGVHGFGKDFNRFTPRITSHVRKANNSRKGKFKHLIVTIFPSKKSMLPSYRYLNKYPFLLPWAWISRWTKLVFKNPKRTLHKSKKLFIEKKPIEDIVNLYDRLGV
ncbi:MAG TPA: nucleotidyltransferase family protein [Bacilli bacterium]|nr:nucleotidyltransferase family protein [Bacilli bacterium]